MEEEKEEKVYDYEAIREALMNHQGNLASIWPSMMAGFEIIEKASNEKLVKMAKNLAWDMEQFEIKKGLGNNGNRL